MQNKRQILDRATIIVTEIVYMLVELCASYLFAPYFGTSNLVWTGIIGVILLSGSIGNYIGGKLALKKDKQYLSFIFALSSIFVFLIGNLSNLICQVMLNIFHADILGSLLAAFIILLPAAICLGTIPPQIMKREVETGENHIGIVYMLSTIGGLVGTFIGGYLLIPKIGVDIIITICGFLLLILSILYVPKGKVFSIIAISVAISIVNIQGEVNKTMDALIFDSEYNRIMIGEGYYDLDGEPMRYMKMAQGFESGTYLRKEKRYDIMFEYFQKIEDMRAINKTGNKMMLIGGAAYQYPKYILAHCPDVSIDVVEIDAKATELAKEYFFLQDCIDEYDPNFERVGLINADAKVYMNNCKKKYDVIINDAFAGVTPVRSLATREHMITTKNLLEPDGLYIMNIIGNPESNKPMFLEAECYTLSTVFLNVYVLDCNPEISNHTKNTIVIATDRTLNTEGLDEIALDYKSAPLLTDNYCPVDSLAPLVN